MDKENKYLYIKWDDFHTTCFALAQTIKKKNIAFDRIAAISRGGLIVARILSDFLDLPISVFTIVAYKSIGKMKKPEIVEGLKVEPKDETILLVDEVADSGQTYQTALAYLGQFRPAKIFTCAPYIKPWAKYKPDFWQVNSSKWIIYPYELKETVRELRRTLSLDQIIALGLPKNIVKILLGE